MNLDQQIYNIARLESREVPIPIHGRFTNYCSRVSYDLEISHVVEDSLFSSISVTYRGVLVYSSSSPTPDSNKRDCFKDSGWTKDIAIWNEVAEHKAKVRAAS